MAESNKKQSTKSSVSDNELPPEFKAFDKPLGMEQHVGNILCFVISHLNLAYYLFYLLPFGYVSKWTLLLGLAYGSCTGLGITIGAHRYWSHRTFKAKMPLQILLMLMQTATLQYPLFKWCRDHRVHHKYSDTDADPHNASRGFWFSHITWMCQPKNKQVEEKLKTMDISDFVNDPIVRFQAKYYWWLVCLMHYFVPMTICYLLFPEMSFSHLYAWNDSRFCYTLHLAAMVNSVAHLWGDKPYDKYIRPVENKLVAILAFGEGWHNYHHTFPWDYKTAEFGNKHNVSTLVINFFAWIGWAYDLKTVSHKLLVDRINRTGDGSHPLHKNEENGKEKCADEMISSEHCWGWGDKQIKKEDLDIAKILFPSSE